MRYKTDTGVQVLARAAAIMRICKDAPGGLSLGTIADRSNLPRSTVQRIVAALAAEGLLLASGDAGSIRIGPGLHALAGSARFDMVEIAHPHLKRLSDETGETVDLAVLRQDHMVFVDQIAGSHRLRAVSAVGERFPLHCTANGKAALARLDEAAFNDICSRGLERFTAATITTKAALRKEMQRIALTGFAVDRQEHSPGISAIGAALEDITGAIYAVSIPMPSLRFARRRSAFQAALLNTVTLLAEELGAKR